MAARKKIIPGKHEPAELILLVPSKLALPYADIKKLQKALQPIAQSTLATSTFAKSGGAVHVVTGITNGKGGKG